MKLIIKIDDDNYATIQEEYKEQSMSENGEISNETVNIILDAFYKGTPIPDNATNIPDNATNGDIIKAMFPNVNDRDFNLRYVSVHDLDNDGGLMIEKEWWNAPYQKGGNVE